MKYVGAGRSTTEKHINSDSKRLLKRPENRQTPNSAAEEFSDYLQNDPKTLIAQWISVIDKILWKPKSGKSIGQAQWVLRDRLGQEAWKRIDRWLPSEKSQRQIRGLDAGEYFFFRLHPYGDKDRAIKPAQKKKNDKGTEKKSGRYFERFAGNNQIETLSDFEGLAVRIEDHLQQSERPTTPHATGNRSRKGQIAGRANAISTSNFDRRMAPRPVSNGDALERRNGFDFATLRHRLKNKYWSADDEAEYVAADDVAAAIHKAAVDHANDSKKKYYRFGSQEAGAIIFSHYRRCEPFVLRSDENKIFRVKTRREIEREGCGSLLALHDTVREFYKTRLRITKKKSVDALPRNAKELFQLLRFRHDNQITNDLIRLGRVLHYEASQKGESEFALFAQKNNKGKHVSDVPLHIWRLDEKQLRESRWFLSDGQAEIKRTEAFVRVWRNLTSQSSQSLKYWFDPDHTIEEDILDANLNKSVIQMTEAGEARISSHLSVIFGSGAGHFAPDPGGTLLFAMNVLRIIRNDIFHFRTRKGFLKTLQMTLNLKGLQNSAIGSVQDESKDLGRQLRDQAKESLSIGYQAAQKLFETDLKAMVDRFHDELHGAWVTAFATDGEYEALLYSIAHAKPVDVDLPKFNRVLAQLQSAELLAIDERRSLPEPARMRKLEKPAAKARYVAMKKVYERPFREWLKKESTADQLKGWIDQAAQKATEGAIENAKDNNQEIPSEAMIVSRAQGRFADLPGNPTLEEFLSDLTASTAREMQVQDGYRSVGDKAHDQAKWIDNFRCGVLGRAFCDYLNRHVEGPSGTNFLLNIRDDSMPFDNHASKPDLSANSDKDVLSQREVEQQEKNKPQEWEQALYAVLHLCPVDDASMLLHQLRKWKALEDQKRREPEADGNLLTDEERLFRVFDTYNAMHDAKFEGDGAGIDFSGFRELFADKEQFKRMFLDPNSEDERLAGAKRGLREIIRFGHQASLMHIFNAHPITNSDLKKLSHFEEETKPGKTRIAQLHDEYQQLHEDAVNFHKQQKADNAENPDTPKPEFNHELTDKYRELVKELSDYRHTVAHVKLVSHVRLHRLLMQVLARLVDYAGLWERDLYFIALALLKLHQPKETRSDQEKLEKWLAETVTSKKLREEFLKSGKLLTNGQDVAPWLWADLRHCHNPCERQTRNDLAHFNFLSPKAMAIDLTEVVNATRNMMKYDRKLKNAVSKSVIEMLYREGLELTWTMKKHQLCQPAISCRDITHLGFMQKKIADWACDAANVPRSANKQDHNNKKQRIRRVREQSMITELRHSKGYQNMVRALFDGDSGSENN